MKEGDTVTATATDPSNNASRPSSQTAPDETAPVVTLNPVSVGATTLSGTVNDPTATVKLTLPNGTEVTATVSPARNPNGTYNFTANVPATTFKGGETVSAKATDTANNTSAPASRIVPQIPVDDVTVTPNADGSMSVTPGANNTKLVVRYFDETGSVKGAEGAAGTRVTFNDKTPTGQGGEAEASSHTVTIGATNQVTLNLVKQGNTWVREDGQPLPTGVTVENGVVKFAPNSIMGDTNMTVTATNGTNAAAVEKTQKALIDEPTNTAGVYLERVHEMSSTGQTVLNNYQKPNFTYDKNSLVINPETYNAKVQPSFVLEFTNTSGQVEEITYKLIGDAWYLMNGTTPELRLDDAAGQGYTLHNDMIVLPASIKDRIDRKQDVRLWTVDENKAGKWQLQDTYRIPEVEEEPLPVYTEISRITGLNNGRPITGFDIDNDINNYHRDSPGELRRIGVDFGAGTSYMNPKGSVEWDDSGSRVVGAGGTLAREIFTFKENSNGYLFTAGDVGGLWTYGLGGRRTNWIPLTFKMTSKEDVIVIGKSFGYDDVSASKRAEGNREMIIDTKEGNDFIHIGGSNPNVKVVMPTGATTGYYDLVANTANPQDMTSNVGQLNGTYYHTDGWRDTANHESNPIPNRTGTTDAGGRIWRGNISMGDGNDTLLVEGQATANEFSVKQSTINMGNGDDRVVIYNGTPANSGVISDSTIDLGAGKDYIAFSGVHGSTRIIGGSGHDIVDFKGAALNYSVLSGIEEVKLSGGTLTASFANVQAAGLESSLRINGSGTVDLDVVSRSGSKVVDGINYNVYKQNDLEILIQNGINVI